MRRLFVLLAALLGGGFSQAAELRFTDDVRVTEAPEGATAVFSVVLSGPGGFPVTVAWTTQDVTAKAGKDYTGAAGTLTFNQAGSQTIAIAVAPDELWEGSETFFVLLSDASGATIADDRAHGVIEDRGSTRARCDVSGDGRSDVIVRTLRPHPLAPGEHISGHEEWTVNGTIAAVGGGDGEAASGWHIVATNEFGGGAGCDLLWRWSADQDDTYPEGTLALTHDVSLAFPPPATENILPATALPAPWRLVGSGRFTADPTADVLWWNQETGALRVWASNGSGFPQSIDLEGNPEPEWHAEAVLDVDADQDGDIVWRHQPSGALAYWNMEVLEHVGGGSFTPGAIAGSCWQLAAAGDFNGDGSDDILWQNQVSQKSVIWFMQGSQRLGGSYLSPELFGDLDTDRQSCPASCQRDCSSKWRIVGPR